MSKKREYIRIPSDFVKCFKAGIDSYEKNFLFGDFISKGLGEEGILIETDQEIKRDALLKLEFTLPKHDKIEAEGKVVKINKLENSKFEIDLEFTIIDEDDQAFIVRFCKKKLKKKFSFFKKGD